MEYGKAFGVGTGSGVAVLGFRLGLGWIVFGALIVTIATIIAIRIFFRGGKSLGQK